MDTIFAVSSGAPPAALAIVRISGVQAVAAGTALAGGLPPPRRAALRTLRDPADGTILDHALVLRFVAPATATGEELVELHLHGGRAVVRAVIACLAEQPGLRHAEPGEFTRRALLSGRIDLTEAEGLGDLLSAETEQQRRAALQGLEGALGRQVAAWTDRVVMLSAEIEAAIDYADEAEVEAAAGQAELHSTIAALAVEMQVALSTPPVERLHDGIRVVIAGPPNAGKSTLLNAMVGRDAAIVSPFAGTTRDRIEIPVSRSGHAWLLTDTAGLVELSSDPIERIGIERSHAAMAVADIVLWLGDDAAPAMSDGTQVIACHSRTDAVGRRSIPTDRIGFSALTGAGIDELWTRLADVADTLSGGGDALYWNRRQRAHIADAVMQLNHAAAQRDLILLAENLRGARFALNAVTGKATPSDVLDRIFGKFCLGK